MIPGKYSLSLYRGDTWRVQFRLWEDAERTDPADLTGVTALAEIRDKSAGLKITPITLVITLPNVITASLSPDETAHLPMSGVWDLQLTLGNGDIQTILAGLVSVTSDVTASIPVPRSLVRQP
jgi:hypothetical protein